MNSYLHNLLFSSHESMTPTDSTPRVCRLPWTSVDFRLPPLHSPLSSTSVQVLTPWPTTLTPWPTGLPDLPRPDTLPKPDLPVGQDRFGYLYPTVGILFGLWDTVGDTQNRRFSSYIHFYYPPKMQVSNFFGFQCISVIPNFRDFQTIQKCRFLCFLVKNGNH